MGNVGGAMGEGCLSVKQMILFKAVVIILFIARIQISLFACLVILLY